MSFSNPNLIFLQLGLFLSSVGPTSLIRYSGGNLSSNQIVLILVLLILNAY